MDTELIKLLASLGVGGAIAVIIFMAYRQDHESLVKLYNQSEQRFDLLVQVLQKNSVASEALSQTITAMMTQNQVVANQQLSDFRLLVDRLLDERPQTARSERETRR